MSQLENSKIFFLRERIPIYFRVQEIVPSFTALFAVATDLKPFVQNFSYVLPLFSPFLSNDLEQLVVFLALPLGLSDVRLMILIPLILALGVISARNQACHILPICTSEGVCFDISFLRIGIDCPV